MTRYNHIVEELDEQTAEIVEQENVEESDAEFEEEFLANVESDDSIAKQVLNNPKVINQYANNIYNIEHVENIN